MARIKKPVMTELTKPYKELTIEERRAYQRGRMNAHIERIMADPVKAAEFKSRASKNYTRFYDSIRVRPKRKTDVS